MKPPKAIPRYAVVIAASLITFAAVAGAEPATAALARPGGRAQPQAGSAGPRLRLVAAQNRVTLPISQGIVLVDPGIYVASLGSALQLDVQRASFTKPVTLTQVIRTPDGTRTRRLPGSTLAGFSGLRQFLWIRVVNARGKTVFARRMVFCPDTSNPQRDTPGGPSSSPYPEQCVPVEPFPVGEVWGIAKGWAVDPVQGTAPALKLSPGTYKVMESITPRYRQLFGITPRAATATVTAQVVRGGAAAVRRPLHRAAIPPRPLPSEPGVPLLENPPQSVLPDLVALPSWGISLKQAKDTSSHPATAVINFGATVWIGGHGPLDVEGFRSHGSPIMHAYQYFWRNGKVIGRVRVGAMGIVGKRWHFQQFAQYRLLNAAKTVALQSMKVGFCISPTDGVDLTLPHAPWQVPLTGQNGACGSPTALWVREMLPLGWGDTYFQTAAACTFNVTSLPNGTYYIEVIANPHGALRETTTRNDTSLRKVILGGIPGHRTLRVPPWHGLDPGGS